MNCLLNKTVKESTDSVTDDRINTDKIINTACEEDNTNSVNVPVLPRERLSCVPTKDRPVLKTSLYNKNSYLLGQETKKKRYSRLIQTNKKIPNLDKILQNCDDPNFIKTGVCQLKEDSGCNNTNVLTTPNIELLKNTRDDCTSFKKRIRHRQVCKTKVN